MFGKPKQCLIDQVCAPQNLLDAWQRVRGNIRVRDRGSSRGSDGVSIADFERDLESGLSRLGRELREGTYRPQPVGRFTLPKRGGGTRTISVLAVRDRVAQRAVQNVIEPLFEARFLDCSYGFRPGRSVADAVARLLAYRQAGYSWVLDADIEKCFDRLDHGTLMRAVRPVVREPAICRLIQAWLEAGLVKAWTAEPIPGGGAIPWDGLMDAAARYLEVALDWGLHHLAGQEEWPPYGPDIPPAGGDPLDPEAVRQRALGRLGREALVLGLTFSGPLIAQARQSLPRVGQALRRRRVAVAALVSLGVVLLPLACQAWLKKQGAGSATGTPQGAVLSPLLANACLHQFDQAMVRQGFAMVRYADDWCVVGRSRAEVERARQVAGRTLARLRLALNEEKTRILRMDDGFVFLGAQFQDGGAHRLAGGGPRWQQVRAGARRAASQAGKCARQVGQRVAGVAREQGGQLVENARRTARDIASDVRHVRVFDQGPRPDPAPTLEEEGGEGQD